MALPVHGGGHRRVSVGTRRRRRAVDARCRCSISAPRPRCWRRCWSAGPACLRRPSTRARCGTRYGPAAQRVSPERARWCRCCGTCRPTRATPSCRCGSSRRRRSRRTCTASIEARYGCRIVTMYGMTEAFPIAYKAVSDEGVPGTSGRVNPGIRRAHRRLRRTAAARGRGRGDRLPGARRPHAMSEGYVSMPPAASRRLAVDTAPGVVPHRRPRLPGRRRQPDLRGPGQGLAAPARRERVVGRGRDDGDAASRRAGGGRRRRPERARRGRHPRRRHVALLARQSITPSCWTSARRGCRTSACRGTWKCSTRFRRTSSGASARTCCAAGDSATGAWDREAHGYVLSR